MPSMGLQRFPAGGFLRGMNLVDNPYGLKSGEAKLARNVDISLRDILAKRRGFVPLESVDGKHLQSQTKSPGNITETLNANRIAWKDLQNLKVGDAANAEFFAKGGNPLSANPSRDIQAFNFGFELPEGIEIAKVEIRFHDVVATGVNIKDFTSRLFYGEGSSSTVTMPAGKTAWASGSDRVYGDVDNPFTPPVTQADVEDINFGFELAVRSTAPGEDAFIAADNLTITVYYYEPVEINNAIDHMRAWYPGKKRYLILSMYGDVYAYDLAEKELTRICEGTEGEIWCFESMEQTSGETLLWMMNGTDKPQKWDGKTAETEDWGGEPPNGSMLRVWKNRMIVTGVSTHPQRLFYSEVGDPEKPSEKPENGGWENNWIDIRTSEDDIDPMTWIETIADVLLAFKRKSTMAIYDPVEFSFQRIADIGCHDRFQSCVVDDRAYFLNRSGIYSVSSTGSLRYESLNLEPMFKGEGPPELPAVVLKQSVLSMARLCSRPNGRFYVALCAGLSEANDVLLEAYPRLIEDGRMTWVYHRFKNRSIRALATYRSEDDQIDKLVAATTVPFEGGPQIVQLFNGARDGDQEIEWEWATGFKSLISHEPIERIRRVNLTMRGEANVQLVEGTVETVFSVETGNSGQEEELVSVSPESRGRYHGLRVFGESDQPVEIYAMEFALRGGKEH